MLKMVSQKIYLKFWRITPHWTTHAFLVGFKQVSSNYSYLRNIMHILCCSPTIHAVFTLFTLHTRWLLVEKRNECYNTSLCCSLVGYLWTVWNYFTRMLFLFSKTCHLFNTILFTQLQAYDWLHYVYIRIVPLLCERWILV